MHDTHALDRIGRVLGRSSLRLRFDPALEAQFEADIAPARARKIVRQSYIGLAIFNACMLRDWLLVPDMLAMSVLFHLGFMTPATFLANGIICRGAAPRLREGLLACSVVLGTASVLAFTILSRSPLRTSEHLSVVLVILYATMIQRIRFRFVLVACLVSLGLYVAALAPLAAQNWARMIVADGVLSGVVLFALIGSYNLEAELRAGYLLARRDRIARDALECLSLRDALTGVGNRRALDQAAARLDASQLTVAVLLIDIDFFKAFNDSSGHLAGDDCLRTVAEIIHGDGAVGPDRVFRFGGEEFLVLLSPSSLAEAMATGERIRRTVETSFADHLGLNRITISAGVAAGALSGEQRVSDIVAEADRALYAAKNGGRNTICAPTSTVDQQAKQAA